MVQKYKIDGKSLARQNTTTGKVRRIEHGYYFETFFFLLLFCTPSTIQLKLKTKKDYIVHFLVAPSCFIFTFFYFVI